MIRKSVGQYLAEKKYIKKILENPADLSEFKEPLTPRLLTGLILIVLSFILGWPLIAALGFLAVWIREPLLVIICGPAAYIFSCAVFLAGAWLSNTPHYMGLLSRYAIKVFFKKFLS